MATQSYQGGQRSSFALYTSCFPEVDDGVVPAPQRYMAGADAGRMKITFITGKGNHSADGPKIKPAVIHYLQDRGHSFTAAPGGGEVYVYLVPPRDDEAGDEEPDLEDPGPSDRGRRGSSSEGSPERRTTGSSGGLPNGVVLGDYFRGC